MNRLPFIFACLICAACVAAEVVITIDGKTYRGQLQLDAPATQPVQPATVPASKPATQPTLTRIVAVRDAPNRGTGVTLNDAKWRQGDQIVVRDLWIENWNMNISGNGLPVPFLIENVYSLRAWRDNPAQAFKGQTCWIGNAPKGGTIRGSVFAYAGWEPGRAANRRSEFAHGFYGYWDLGPVLFDNCIFARNPNAGIQLKNCGTIQNCLIFDCGIGVLSLRGPTVLRNVLIVDGHRFAMIDGAGNIQSWSGDTAVSAYGPIDLENVWALGGPLQRAPDIAPVPGKSFDQPAFNGSKVYDPRPPISDGKTAEWKTPAGKPDPGAPQGAKWTIGNNVRANFWLGGSAGGSVPPAGIQVAPLISDAQYQKIKALVDEATTYPPKRPVKDIIDEAFKAAGMR